VDGGEGRPMRVQLFTFRYSATLGGFDDRPLAHFIRDKEVLSFREHFFCGNEVPHILCVVTWQDCLVTLPVRPPVPVLSKYRTVTILPQSPVFQAP
jgi:hypothetical protein